MTPEILQEQCRSLHQDKEALIARKKKLLNELNILEDRINQVDKHIESNLTLQEMYWPGFNEADSELLIEDDLVQYFYLHPDKPLREIGGKFNASIYLTSKRISKHLAA